MDARRNLSPYLYYNVFLMDLWFQPTKKYFNNSIFILNHLCYIKNNNNDNNNESLKNYEKKIK